ncbi:MAG: carboxypeptidase C prc1, partial [Paramarteilia canceri]
KCLLKVKDSERDFLSQVESDIKDLETKNKDLCTKLKISQCEVMDSLPLIQKNKILEQFFIEKSSILETLLRNWNEEKLDLEKYSKILGTCETIDLQSEIPSEQEIERLSSKVRELKEQIISKTEKIQEIQSNLKTLNSLLDQPDIPSLTSTEYSDLSPEFFNKLQTTIDKLQKELNIKEKVYKDMLSELIEKEICKINELIETTGGDINDFPVLMNIEKDEDFFNQICTYTVELEARKDVTDQIKIWLDTVQELAEIERGPKDPNRFKNRGGILLEEEKKKKTLQKNKIKVLKLE